MTNITMKKTSLSLIALFSALQFSYAQNTFPTSGNVGIGTISPLMALTVTNGTIFSNSPSQNAGTYMTGGDGAYGLIQAVTSANTAGINMVLQKYGGNVGIGTTTPSYKIDVTGSGRFTTGSYVNDGQAFGVVSAAGVTWANNTLIYKGYNNTIGDYAEMLVPGGPVYSANVRLLGNGNVGIGTPTPDQKLSVNGTIHSKRVLVDLNGWADYVFKPEYKLPPLSEVSSYIDQNKHLPDVPSEKELEKSGVDVTEMLKLQMKKIEELTLYLIGKDRQVEQQRKEIDILKRELEALNQKVNAR